MATSEDNAPNQRAEALYQQLRDRILSGELGAGERLPPERELARSLGTNRNTLREVIRRLEQERLVSARQGRGVVVLEFRRTASIDILGPFLEACSDEAEKARTLLDLLSPRARLVEHLVELATGRATAEDLERLKAAGHRARAAEEARDGLALAQAQVDWVEALIDAAHNVPARWIANPLLSALSHLLFAYQDMQSYSVRFSDHAEAVHSAMADGDFRAALAATRLHHERIDHDLRRALSPIAGQGRT